MSSRIPRPLVSSGKATTRTCCAKHRRDDRSSAHFENASGFSISKGDFSAIRGHRYGGLRVSGKMVVIHQGVHHAIGRTKLPQHGRDYHAHHDGSDSDASTGTSSSGSTATVMSIAERKPRQFRRRIHTPKFSERRAVLEDAASALKQRQREMEEESQATLCRQRELEAREAWLRTQEAEATLREQIIQAREEDLDRRVQTTRARQQELEDKEVDLRQKGEAIEQKDEEVRRRELLANSMEAQFGARTCALDDREASLDQRERDLLLREKEIQNRSHELEQREEIVKKTEEDLRQTERALLALEVRIREQLEAMRTKCAELRRVRENFAAHRDGWMVAAAAKAAEFSSIEKEVVEIIGDFGRRETAALPPFTVVVPASVG